jgi:hypothetical protein
MPILIYFKLKKKLGFFISDNICFLGDLKGRLRNEPLKIKKNTFGNLILDFSLDFKSTWKKMKP